MAENSLIEKLMKQLFRGLINSKSDFHSEFTTSLKVKHTKHLKHYQNQLRDCNAIMILWELPVYPVLDSRIECLNKSNVSTKIIDGLKN